jgi:hypothetical protein
MSRVIPNYLRTFLVGAMGVVVWSNFGCDQTHGQKSKSDSPPERPVPTVADCSVDPYLRGASAPRSLAVVHRGGTANRVSRWACLHAPAWYDLQVSDQAEPHRSRTVTDAKLFIVDQLAREVV